MREATPLVLRWPALPVLTDFVNTMVAKVVACAGDAVEGVTFLQSSWYSEARVEVVDSLRFEGCFEDVAASASKQLVALKPPIVSMGPAGDTQQMGKVAAELGLQQAKGKLYKRVARLIEEFARNYSSRLPAVAASRWEESVKDKVVIKAGGAKGYPFPSIVRSVSLYEGGRFSGFRDDRASGPLSKGVFEVRCDGAWWVLSLAAAGASLAAVERGKEESRLVFVSFEPVYGVRYESLYSYWEFYRAAEKFVRGVGLFVEDEELYRLTLLFYLYSTLSSPLIPARFGLRLRGIRAAGKRFTRFTEAYVTSIYASEVAILHRTLREHVGAASREAAEACADLGRFAMTITRSSPTIARELHLDAFAARLKSLMRALSEPGYTPPSELIYDLLRMMRVPEWRARFVGLLSSRLQEWRGLQKESAVEEARRKYDEVVGLVSTVAKLTR